MKKVSLSLFFTLSLLGLNSNFHNLIFIASRSIIVDSDIARIQHEVNRIAEVQKLSLMTLPEKVIENWD